MIQNINIAQPNPLPALPKIEPFLNRQEKNFSSQYGKWKKNNRYKTDQDQKILSVIKNNLRVLGEVQQGEKITRLNFLSNGHIEQLENNLQQGKVSVKTKELKNFTQFVSLYFEAHSLSEKESWEIKETLQKAKKGIIFLLPPSEARQHVQRFNESVFNVILNEEMNLIGEANLPGIDIIIRAFNEVQAVCREQNQEIQKWNTPLKITVFNRVFLPLAGIASAALLFFVPLAGLLLVLLMMTLFAANEVLRFVIKLEIDPTREVFDENLKYLTEIEMHRRHYEEPEIEEFRQFVQRLPEGWIEIAGKSHDLHCLYEKEKQLVRLNDQLAQEQVPAKRNKLKDEIEEIRESIVHIRWRCDLRQVYD